MGGWIAASAAMTRRRGAGGVLEGEAGARGGAGPRAGRYLDSRMHLLGGGAGGGGSSSIVTSLGGPVFGVPLSQECRFRSTGLLWSPRMTTAVERGFPLGGSRGTMRRGCSTVFCWDGG